MMVLPLFCWEGVVVALEKHDVERNICRRLWGTAGLFWAMRRRTPSFLAYHIGKKIGLHFVTGSMCYLSLLRFEGTKSENFMCILLETESNVLSPHFLRFICLLLSSYLSFRYRKKNPMMSKILFWFVALNSCHFTICVISYMQTLFDSILKICCWGSWYFDYNVNHDRSQKPSLTLYKFMSVTIFTMLLFVLYYFNILKQIVLVPSFISMPILIGAWLIIICSLLLHHYA